VRLRAQNCTRDFPGRWGAGGRVRQAVQSDFIETTSPSRRTGLASLPVSACGGVVVKARAEGIEIRGGDAQPAAIAWPPWRRSRSLHSRGRQRDQSRQCFGPNRAIHRPHRDDERGAIKLCNTREATMPTRRVPEQLAFDDHKVRLGIKFCAHRTDDSSTMLRSIFCRSRFRMSSACAMVWLRLHRARAEGARILRRFPAARGVQAGRDWKPTS